MNIFTCLYTVVCSCSDISIVLYVRDVQKKKYIYNIVEQPKRRELLIMMLINSAIELSVWIKYGIKCREIISSHFQNGLRLKLINMFTITDAQARPITLALVPPFLSARSLSTEDFIQPVSSLKITFYEEIRRNVPGKNKKRIISDSKRVNSTISLTVLPDYFGHRVF